MYCNLAQMKNMQHSHTHDQPSLGLSNELTITINFCIFVFDTYLPDLVHDNF